MVGHGHLGERECVQVAVHEHAGGKVLGELIDDRVIHPPRHGRCHCRNTAFGVDRRGERQADADEWAVGWVERLGDERGGEFERSRRVLCRIQDGVPRCSNVQAESGDDDPNPVRVDLEAGDDR